MEPITAELIQSIFLAGAAFVSAQVASVEIKDHYLKLKARLQSLGVRGIEQLEQQPTSNACQAIVGEDIERGRASIDPEVARLTRELQILIEAQPPDVARSVGVDIQKLINGKAYFKEVIAHTGATGAKINDATGSELIFDKVVGGADIKKP